MGFDLEKLTRVLSDKTPEEKKKILEKRGNLLINNPKFIWLQPVQAEITKEEIPEWPPKEN